MKHSTLSQHGQSMTRRAFLKDVLALTGVSASTALLNACGAGSSSITATAMPSAAQQPTTPPVTAMPSATQQSTIPPATAMPSVTQQPTIPPATAVPSETQSATKWTPVTSIDFSSKHNVLIKNDDGTTTPMDVPYFTSKQVAPGTWQIRSDGDHFYLVEGDNEAIAIDTGYGAGNVREYLQSLTQKPIRYVFNTHYHFDHTAGDPYFDTAYMSAESKPKATIPYPSFSGIVFPRDYPTVIIGEGYRYQLGNRELEVFEIANHTEGGIAFLDRKERILFSGDEVMGSNIRLNVSVAQFEQNMAKLAAHRSEFDTLCGGPDVMDAAFIDKYLATARYILSGQGVPTKVQSSPASMPTPTDPSAPIVYTRGRVRPGDGGPSSTNEFTVSMKYNDTTITYDSRRIT